MTQIDPFETLADPTRRRIVEALRDGERQVGDIVLKAGVHQSGVSRHLRILHEAGFVSVRPDGQRRLYALRPEPFQEFEAWLAGQRASAQEPTDPVARRGREVFLSGSCALCHTILGTPAGARSGPDLTHVASRTTLGAGTMPNTTGHLAGWIVDPQGVKPGARMPASSMGPDDLQALLAYLGSLR